MIIFGIAVSVFLFIGLVWLAKDVLYCNHEWEVIVKTSSNPVNRIPPTEGGFAYEQDGVKMDLHDDDDLEFEKDESLLYVYCGQTTVILKCKRCGKIIEKTILGTEKKP